MKSAKNWLSSAALALLLVGCTVIPKTPEAPGASYDNGTRNSGFIGWTNYDLMVCGIITTNALARYNSLIETYGGRFNPPIHAGNGTCTNCLPGLVLIQSQDLEHFTRMQRWKLAETK